jgi:L-asparagine transporter-like permease
VATVLPIAFAAYGYLQGNAFGTLVAATATLPYLMYLLTVIAYGLRRREMLEQWPGAFSLGAWGKPVFVATVIWLVAVLLVLIIPPDFRGADYVVIGTEVVAFLWYIAGLRPRLEKGVAATSELRSEAALEADAERPR